jgi:hypothetical protein
MKKTTIGRSLAILAGVLVAGAVSGQDITWNVTTDRSEYLLGEPVMLMLEACNGGPLPQVVDVNRAAAVIDEGGVQRFAPTLLPFATEVEIAAGECRPAQTAVWDQRDSFAVPYPTQVGPGWYRGEHHEFGGPQYRSDPFLIRQAEAVPIQRWALSVFAVVVGAAGVAALRVCRT